MEFKICNRCNTELPMTTEYFNLKMGSKDGYKKQCRTCTKQMAKDYKIKNPNNAKEYYKNNKETLDTNQKIYYLNHREKYLKSFREYSKEYYVKNINAIKVYRDKWNEENPQYYKENYEKTKAKRYEYYIENREHILKVKKIYRGKEDVKLKESESQKERYKNERHRTIRNILNQKRRSLAIMNPLSVNEWTNVKSLFKNRCAYCGSLNKLTQDHIIPLSKGGTYTNNNIIPACGRCNSSKGNKDLKEWYTKQEFYSKEKLQSILRVQTNIG